jgi:hypothetical protein|tara:strand:+ start:17201 stop:17650 length:450 start_codon:yes stop_codon:yes gene_type:complete
MIIISHRGNLSGPNPGEENKPEYIYAALKKGYHVEVDVWYKDGEWFLGHDEPTYVVAIAFLLNDNMWIHAKNLAAFVRLEQFKKCNYFWHQTDDYTLTSKQFAWCYPGKPGVEGYNCICVLPERTDQDITAFAGICTDYVEKYDKTSIV